MHIFTSITHAGVNVVIEIKYTKRVNDTLNTTEEIYRRITKFIT